MCRRSFRRRGGGLVQTLTYLTTIINKRDQISFCNVEVAHFIVEEGGTSCLASEEWIYSRDTLNVLHAQDPAIILIEGTRAIILISSLVFLSSQTCQSTSNTSIGLRICSRRLACVLPCHTTGCLIHLCFERRDLWVGWLDLLVWSCSQIFDAICRDSIQSWLVLGLTKDICFSLLGYGLRIYRATILQNCRVWLVKRFSNLVFSTLRIDAACRGKLTYRTWR